MTTYVGDACLSLDTLHGYTLRSLQMVHYDWRLTRRKAEDLIQADLDVPGWIKFVMMLGSPINVVVHRGC